jgi:hypothetical protein
MMSMKPDKARMDRRRFIGGSDASILMSPTKGRRSASGGKSGEAEPGDFSGNLIVQLGVAIGAQPHPVPAQNRAGGHRRSALGFGTLCIDIWRRPWMD